ncbi:hypothetical protein [uncultured Rhodoblastus sp.]|uniref:hypothetical protein n=1 Tax=uncultured Rhodoblastus sp. TaxID=543037 RepID=UPI0025DE121D|nr:hypothetical protein [uncultured Rhodoblastus sp.]
MISLKNWIEKHPKWFEQSRIDIEGGHEGWRQLIDDVFTAAEQILSDNPGALFRITQVKEKLGALTIYFRHEGLPAADVDRLRGIKFIARERSLHVCEICGAPANLGALDSCLSVRCGSCAPAGWLAIYGDRSRTISNP